MDKKIIKFTGSGCKSKSSVGGTFFSGNSKCLNETGNCVSEPIQRSETIL
jgi:hypothetical protein